MQLRLQVSGANGVGIFSPETTEGLESILGNKVIL